MPNPQDVAVPSLPEPELPPLPATQLRFQVELTPTGERLDYTARDMNARYVEGYEAGLAAGRASAEPDGVREALRNLLAMLPSDHEDRPSTERIPASYCYVRWIDIREARAALAAAPTPTASIAPKAEGETVAPAANGPKYNPVWAELHPCGDSWHGIDADGDGVTMTEGEFNESIRLGATVGDPDRRAAPVAQAAAGAREPIRKLLAEVLLFFHDCSESIRCIDRVVDLEERIGDALARPEADADRASGGGV